MNEQYHGMYAALVPPYTSDGAVNYSELQKIVDHLIGQGLDGFTEAEMHALAEVVRPLVPSVQVRGI